MMSVLEPSPAARPAGAAESGSSGSEGASERHIRRSTILIVDADSLFVDAVTPRLESFGMRVMQAHSTLGQRLPSADIVIVDADGPREGRISFDDDESPTARVLISSNLDYVGARWAIQHGYSAAISKDIPIDRFESAIGSVLDGDMVVEVTPATPSRRPTSEADVTDAITASLTSRELEILSMLVDGASSSDITTRLSLSPHTVRTHIQNMMTKLQVHSRVEAVAFAVRIGLIRPDAEDDR